MIKIIIVLLFITFPNQAFAFIDGAVNGIVGTSTVPDERSTYQVFSFKAYDILSYSSADSQKWKNLEASPYDGSAQTAYDLALGDNTGNTVNDPSLTGTEGTAGTCWNMGGGKTFNLVSSNPAFITDLSKTTGSDFTVVLTGKTDSGLGGVGQVMWGTQNDSSAAGVNFNFEYSNRFKARHYGGSGAGTTDVRNIKAVDSDEWFFAAWGHRNGNPYTRIYYNGIMYEEAQQWNVSGAASSVMHLGNHPAGGAPLQTGFYICSLDMYAKYLNDKELLALMTERGSEQGRSYAPSVNYRKYEWLNIEWDHNNTHTIWEVRVTDWDGNEWFTGLNDHNGTGCDTMAEMVQADGCSNGTINNTAYISDNAPDITSSSSAVGSNSIYKSTGVLNVWAYPRAEKTIRYIDIAISTGFSASVTDIVFKDGAGNVISPTTSPSSNADTYQTTSTSPTNNWYRWEFPNTIDPL